jgi:potassium/hydrogen antiporter
MSDVEHFALIMLVVAVAITAAVLSNRISERIRVPAPAIFLLAAAVASDVVPTLGEVSVTTVQRVVTVALAVILFDGGMHIGWRRFREAAGPVIWVGVAGTFVTAAALAALAHILFGLEWRAALLLGTALAPTDPAVVFSVLGRREVAGRSGTILEGESGANDPVGIALMASLLTVGQTSGVGAVGGVAGESCCSSRSARWWGWPAGRCWWGSCAGCRCPAKRCTRCGSSPASCSSMARRRSRTARAS